MNKPNRRSLLITCFIGLVIISVLIGRITAHPIASLAQNPHTNAPSSPATPPEWKPVEQAMGKSGTMQPGDVFKFGLPRTDLQVTARSVLIKPTFALGSWVAFKKMGNEAMVMGDLVLTQDEITPVMTKLQSGGIEQTALHNHIPDPSPVVMYMHIQGKGAPVKMAQSIHDAIAVTKTPFTAPKSGTPSVELGFDTKQLDQIMGDNGKLNGGVYQFGIPRAEKITDEGMEVPPAMGTATAINFQPTGSGKAAITGDFVLIASEVNPVIEALRANSIEVTALHSHMINEEPRTFYMHFWANDDAVKLARGLRTALDKTHLTQPS